MEHLSNKQLTNCRNKQTTLVGQKLQVEEPTQELEHSLILKSVKADESSNDDQRYEGAEGNVEPLH